MLRRSLLVATLAAGLTAERAAAQSAAARPGPFRLGADRALVESGLTARLVGAFGADTGLAVQVVPGPALAVLDAVRDGEVDAALCNAPEAEENLARQTLVHARKSIAIGGFVLVGPRAIVEATPAEATGSSPGSATTAAAPQAKPGRAPARPTAAPTRAPTVTRDIVAALRRLQAMGTAAPGSVVFLSAGDGSGEHVAEQALWRAAGVDPTATGYAKGEPGRSLAEQARQRGAFAVVERGAWSARGGAPLRLLVDGDPLLDAPVHAMLSFRASHPAARLFIGWVGGRPGKAAAARVAGYRAA